ncbi:hypothetical protein SCATT_p14820 (plasmid) [Streptantibioticus cattleyicolor NRRL 8057 = DSM 46488]|uniref:Uncharacterized protein n=1 Tax=Streptantibioticus cattleyicolor (strain ATCC 35852 / DSM 46488 / JCM 4925 / NBRC 14057 / NRRL 8057) TaxID=1003195 RepID=G8XGM6_STREN|nr:hypothetical protein SCATT_p14820 [Streptantibioticus cattleyicolor NRRL 8057 = DSM 46488]
MNATTILVHASSRAAVRDRSESSRRHRRLRQHDRARFAN